MKKWCEFFKPIAWRSNRKTNFNIICIKLINLINVAFDIYIVNVNNHCLPLQYPTPGIQVCYNVKNRGLRRALGEKIILVAAVLSPFQAFSQLSSSMKENHVKLIFCSQYFITP